MRVVAPPWAARPGVQRKHDKRDATDRARFYHAGELTAVRVPTEADVRVRHLVRCRESFQREILKSRHCKLPFLTRSGSGRRREDASGGPSDSPSVTLIDGAGQPITRL